MRLPTNEAGLIKLIADAKQQLENLRKDRVKVRSEYSASLIKRAKPGMILLLAKPAPARLWVSNGGVARAVRLQHQLTPGAMLKVDAVQPRAGRVWAKDGRDTYCFESFDERCLVDVYPDEITAQIAYATKRGPVFEL